MPDASKILRLIRYNAHLKLLAIFLASICWFLVREETSNLETIHGIPVVLNPPDGWIIRSQSLAKVAVEFSGSRGDLHALSDENVEVTLDMKDDSTPTTTVKLAAKHVRAPAGVRAIRIVPPASVLVRLDKK